MCSQIGHERFDWENAGLLCFNEDGVAPIKMVSLMFGKNKREIQLCDDYGMMQNSLEEQLLCICIKTQSFLRDVEGRGSQ